MLGLDRMFKVSCLRHVISHASMRHSLNSRFNGLVHIARIGSTLGIGLLVLE